MMYSTFQCPMQTPLGMPYCDPTNAYAKFAERCKKTRNDKKEKKIYTVCSMFKPDWMAWLSSS